MTGPSLLHIADRVLNRPLLLHPGKAEVILHVLEGRIPLGDAALSPLTPDASRFVGERRGGLSRIDGGVAIISVIGSLVNRGAWIGASSGMTSYEGLGAQLREAASDRKVKAILLDLDSPGGEATGMFGLAEQIRAITAQKPVTAVVNDMAASAAYGLASQASRIVVSPTSLVGSIGVVLAHLDRSGELAAKGIKPTLIYAGAHKVDGNPYGPLSDAVRADLQAQVAKFYDQFVGVVAQGRGDRLNEQNARATEARTFIGQEAVDRGLADEVASFEAVLASLQSESPTRATRQSSSHGPDAAAMARVARTLAVAGQASTPARVPASNPASAAFAAIVGHFGFADVSATTRRAEASGTALQVVPARPRQTAGIDRAMADRAWASAVAETNAEIAPDPVAQPEPAAAAEVRTGGPAADRASIWSKAVSDANADLAAGRLGAD